jgi:uncharacterized protein
MPDGGDAFLGQGWKWPVQLVTPEPTSQPSGADSTREIAMSALEASVRESILLIIGTARGERVMRPDFGCGIHDLVFAPNDTTTAALASHEVRESLIEFEPRAQVMDLTVTADPDDSGTLRMQLQYRVRSTNHVFNLVYPFYLEKSSI